MTSKITRLLLGTTILLLLTSCSSSSSDSGDSPSSDACSVLGLNTRIVNGTPCQEGGSPIVRLQITTTTGVGALCSGTLVTPDKVVTAGHCFFNPVSRVVVQVDGRSADASSVQVHPQLSVDLINSAVINDVAIVTLAQPLNNQPTLPLLLSSNTSNNDIISIFGYGIDQNGEVGILRSGQMKVSMISPNHIFSNFDGEGSNTCSGDSGGPAVLQVTRGDGRLITGIVGLTSSGSLVTCEPGDLSLFTNLQGASVVDFLTGNIPGLRVE